MESMAYSLVPGWSASALGSQITPEASQEPTWELFVIAGITIRVRKTSPATPTAAATATRVKHDPLRCSSGAGVRKAEIKRSLLPELS